MSDVRDLIGRLERVEVELALRRLAHQYCIAADHRDLDLWLAVWTPDAVWETGSEPDHVYSGADAIAAAVQRQWETFPVMQHGTVDHVVDLGAVADGVATGRSDVIVHVQLGDTTWSTAEASTSTGTACTTARGGSPGGPWPGRSTSGRYRAGLRTVPRTSGATRRCGRSHRSRTAPVRR